MKSLSIVIPVYNGANSIGQLVPELIASFSQLFKLEIVLINDCSPDDSENRCIQLFEKYPRWVKFYSLAKNVGEHNAVMAGLNKCSGDKVVIMDDDFQNPTESVIQLVTYASTTDFDVVYSYYDSKKHSLFRNLGSRFNNAVASWMLKKPTNLYLSSFKVLDRFLVEEIIKYNHPFPYIDGLILRTTSNIGKVKVVHNARQNGESGYTLSKLISLWLNMFTNFSILPLRVAMITGLIIAMCGFIYGGITIGEKLINPNLPVGYASTIASITLFSGVQLMAIGMVGEYLGRLFLCNNKHPQFSIRKSYTQEDPNITH
ncbi:glycosyltransferase family 2 protein [Marinifilum flexuosum]|uniref:Undecaprenyl-phosphate 4-deoxy-4-formamido-L-arabinose transferase n=1 Tax=Marinifilum flexuosum TaxID=1117708 RepID=A0A419X998_9BACT|nr:glycosyltransferase family 2 protein [Marinifilum flexuosum]RKE04334.1 undecaprenyl-phosphate 4-deoxy-4-formamido-L-arabinose transferase [Marinifilum flexuosum]